MLDCFRAQKEKRKLQQRDFLERAKNERARLLDVMSTIEADLRLVGEVSDVLDFYDELEKVPETDVPKFLDKMMIVGKFGRIRNEASILRQIFDESEGLKNA